MEPVLRRFEKEAQSINNLSMNLSANEKMDFLRRIYMAKETIIHLDSHLSVKLTFINKLAKKKSYSK